MYRRGGDSRRRLVRRRRRQRSAPCNTQSCGVRVGKTRNAGWRGSTEMLRVRSSPPRRHPEDVLCTTANQTHAAGRGRPVDSVRCRGSQPTHGHGDCRSHAIPSCPPPPPHRDGGQGASVGRQRARARCPLPPAPSSHPLTGVAARARARETQHRPAAITSAPPRPLLPGVATSGGRRQQRRPLPPPRRGTWEANTLCPAPAPPWRMWR